MTGLGSRCRTVSDEMHFERPSSLEEFLGAHRFVQTDFAFHLRLPHLE